MPDKKVTFDVFLSHNSRDKPAVREIAEALEARKLNVWLDETELIPGRRWIAALQQALAETATVAVCIGENGLGPWMRPEIEGALIESVDNGLPVIPVLLPNAPVNVEVPLFLRAFTWVDLRKGMSDEGIDRLEWGIRGKKTAPTPSASRLPPPRLHNLPFSSLGDLLKGRDEELRKLQDGAATAITQAETIYGLGGVGKTRLAVEHAWRSGNLYDYAFFVVAESPEALHSGLANLARPDLLNLPEYKAAAQEESLAAVLRWLREHVRWLLILDNVDTKEAEQAVVKVVPALSAGRVLITSRIKDWPAGIRRQQIETLSLEEAQRLILERTADDRTRKDDDPDQALRLAEELGGLPLALEQAAAYIGQRQMSLSEYLEEWEKERARVLNWYDGSVMHYPAPVAVTWQKTFQQLSPTAAAILRLTAYLAPDPIPSKMFEEGAEIVREAVGLLCEETGTQVDNNSIKEAITELASYSMVTKLGASFTVHRMVQDALRSRIPEKWRQYWIKRSLKIVNRFAPSNVEDFRTWPTWDSLRSHTAQVIQYADDAGVAFPTARLLGELAVFLYTKGLYLEAEPMMRRALQISEDYFGSQHPAITKDINNLALLFYAKKNFSEAEHLIRRALQIDEDHLDTQHSNVARDLNNLGGLLRITNRVEESENLLRRALQIREVIYGPNHPYVAVGLGHLALLLRETKRFAEAEPMDRRALKIAEDYFGPEHPRVATRLNNLALLLQDTNRLVEAEPLMRRAVEIWERSFGSDHPETRNGQKNLEFLLRKIATQSEPPSSPEGAQA